MKNFRRYFLVVALLMVSCSDGLDGEYSNGSGLIIYKFKSGGKVDMITRVLGLETSVEKDYKLEDGKVKLVLGDGLQQVMIIDKDGCLDGGEILGKMCKTK